MAGRGPESVVQTRAEELASSAVRIVSEWTRRAASQLEEIAVLARVNFVAAGSGGPHRCRYRVYDSARPTCFGADGSPYSACVSTHGPRDDALWRDDILQTIRRPSRESLAMSWRW